jgi:mannonate dehydratase
MLDDEHLRFARQMGATHIIVHLCDYFNQNAKLSSSDQPVGDIGGWGHATGELWTVSMLREIRDKIEAHGLVWYGVENFDPLHWDHILFNGPRKFEQIETLKTLIRNLGEVGIPVMGYNFSLTGVTGRMSFGDARGGAQTVGMDGSNPIIEAPLPNSMAWNMIVDPLAKGFRDPMTEEQLWANLSWFLQEIIPVAEEANVIMALHPDDPPLEVVRGLPKLVNQPEKYQRVIDIHPSRSNALEFCLGTISEMTHGDVYEATRHYVSQDRVAYVHLRNVIGKVPHYKEVFIDEGQIDVKRIIAILKDCEFDGVIIPDHSPQVSCPAPWHAGMAFAMGYITAFLKN